MYRFMPVSLAAFTQKLEEPSGAVVIDYSGYFP